jgi:glycosyltransferase involved in cell wall biosynthesis
MRVLFVSHCSGLYGAVRSLLDLLDGLRGSCEIAVAYYVAPGELDLAPELSRRDVKGFRTMHVSWLGSERTAVRYVGNLKAMALAPGRLVRQMGGWTPDIVVSNSSATPLGMLVARKLRTPHVWWVREPPIKPLWGRMTLRLALRSADWLVFVSHYARRAHFGRAFPPHSTVIYDGILPADAFATVRTFCGDPFPPTRPLSLSLVGRIDERKGQMCAIEALGIVASRVPAARLIITGGGSAQYQTRCRRRAGELGLTSRIEWRGVQPDPWPTYRDADLALMCSTREALGRVTIEAMASGRPVIGRDAGATPELIKHGQTGLLYRDGPPDLARRILELAEDHQLAARLADQGWQFARGRFSMEHCARPTREIIEEMGRRPRNSSAR